MKFKKLKSSKMSEAVANQILKLIKEGSLKEGDKLPTEIELVESLGVSRTAIREGMQRLLMINVIEIQPGRGTFVRSISKGRLLRIKKGLNTVINKKTLLEITEIRKIFEIGIIELVINKISSDDLKKLGECIKSHEKGLVKGILPAKGDIDFHKILAMATHNKVLMSFYNDIYILILDSVIGFDNYKIDYKKALKFHKEIYNSLLKKDKVAAKEAMASHLDWLMKIISKSED